MAFNGSKAVPEGEMVKILERLGLAFGADTNASTSFDETIYKLDLPQDRRRDRRHLADAAARGRRRTDHRPGRRRPRARRGAVRGARPRHARPTGSSRQRLDFLLPGQRLPDAPADRQGRGAADTRPASQIADFYHRYYRPERAVLVAVGDFDPAAMEAKIKARFGDWKAVGPAGAEPDLGQVAAAQDRGQAGGRAGRAAAACRSPGSRPPDLAPDTVAKRARRPDRAAGLRGAQPPALGAWPASPSRRSSAPAPSRATRATPPRSPPLERHRRARRLARGPGRRRPGAAPRRAVRRAPGRARPRDRRGPRQRCRPPSPAPPPAARPSSPTRSSARSATTRWSPARPRTWPSSRPTVKGLKADTVSAALKAAFAGEGPLVFMASPKPVAGRRAGAARRTTPRREGRGRRAGRAARRSPGPTRASARPARSPRPREVADLDTVFVRFENGVRLTVKPTKFRDDEVLVRVNVGDGLQRPAQRPPEPRPGPATPSSRAA